MTLAEVHSDETLRQHEFPVTGKKIFLAHAGDCPLPLMCDPSYDPFTWDELWLTS